MAASKLKLKTGPLDVWSVRERLSLASSVLRNGDQNWVSVSRAIKPFGEADRPPDWFSQKNCALQYSELLEKVETPKRKRGDRGEIETPGNQIIRKLTIERIEELKKMVLEEQQKYKKLKKDVEMIRTGQWDDKLPEVWATMQAEKAAAVVKKATTPKKSEAVPYTGDAGQDKGVRPKKLIISPPSVSEAEDSTQDSLGNMSNDEDSNQTIPGASLARELTEVDVTSPQVHPLTVPGALTKLQALTTTPVPSFQVTPGGATLTPPTVPQTSPQTNLGGRGTKTTPPSSPLLSSLLKSKHHSAELLQQMKTEVEQGQAAHQLAHTLVTSPAVASHSAPAAPNQTQDIKKLPSSFKMVVSQADGLSSSSGAPTLSKLLAVPAMAKSALTGQTAVTVTQSIQNMIVETELTKPEVVPQAVEEVVLTTAPPSGGHFQKTFVELPAPAQNTPSTPILKQEVKQEVIVVKEEEVDCETVPGLLTGSEVEVKTEPSIEVAESPATDPHCPHGQLEECSQPSTLVTEDEVSIKEEPLSPCSSVSSRVSETGTTKTTRKRRKGRRSKGGRMSTRLTRKHEEKKDDASSKPSDGESSDEERESDGSIITAKLTPVSSTTTPAFSESIPNSPLSQCSSDTEDERAYKSWKKSIMLVWRAASTHKYASLFLHPVTNDIAPGYHTIVHRPMDLSVIKKNIETGVMRTTGEFQRDMMLMFTNAIMYNSSDHNVYRMALEMYNDVLQHIEQYVSTQLMVQTNEAKILRATRRPDNVDKEEDAKKRRTSADQQDGGKSKKRKP